MGDVVNATFGSILVDSNYDLEVVRRFYQTTLFPFTESHCVGPGETGPHPRTVWSEMASKRGCQRWEIRKEEGGTGGAGGSAGGNVAIGEQYTYCLDASADCSMAP